MRTFKVLLLACLAANVSAHVAKSRRHALEVRDDCTAPALDLYRSASGIKDMTEEAFAAAFEHSSDVCELLSDFSIASAASGDVQERANGAGWQDSYGYWHPGRAPVSWVFIGLLCADCMKTCLADNGFTWSPGVIFDNNGWTLLTTCGVNCALTGSCSSAAAATWAARQRTDNVIME